MCTAPTLPAHGLKGAGILGHAMKPGGVNLGCWKGGRGGILAAGLSGVICCGMVCGSCCCGPMMLEAGVVVVTGCGWGMGGCVSKELATDGKS